MSIEDKFMDWAGANLWRLQNKDFHICDIITVPITVAILGLIFLKAVVVNKIKGTKEAK